jgi:hypothetical protein
MTFKDLHRFLTDGRRPLELQQRRQEAEQDLLAIFLRPVLWVLRIQLPAGLTIGGELPCLASAGPKCSGANGVEEGDGDAGSLKTCANQSKIRGQVMVFQLALP